MPNTQIVTRLVSRHDVKANWESKDPVLLKGEIGIEIDNNLFKIGDGVAKWSELKYAGVDLNQILNLISAAEDKYFSVVRNEGESDNDAITRALNGEVASQGDVCVIKTALGTEPESYSFMGYVFDGENWGAMDGNVSSDNVIMSQDITLAGSYTQVGNIKKGVNETKTHAAKGKTMTKVWESIFTKELNPTATAPAVTLTFSQEGAKEVGTSISPTYSASLSAGSYTYGPTTGITATSWSVTDTAGHSSTEASGSFEGFIVGDDTDYSITAVATYDAGTVPVTNLGAEYPEAQIPAGSASKTVGASVTGYRSYFYGILATSSVDAPLSSSIIRGLTNGGAYTEAATLELKAADVSGAKRVVVAIPASSTRAGVTKVTMPSAMNADATANFKVVSNVDVEGVDGYTAVPYKVWVYEPATIDSTEEYTITLG